MICPWRKDGSRNKHEALATGTTPVAKDKFAMKAQCYILLLFFQIPKKKPENCIKEIKRLNVLHQSKPTINDGQWIWSIPESPN